MRGYLKLHRTFFSHWLWDEGRSFSKAEAFLDLLQLAAWVPTKRIVSGSLIELEQGELVASIRYLGARWMWGKDKVADYLKMLESDSIIRRKSRHGETVITLVNYASYNGPPDTEADTETDGFPDSEPTVSRQTPDKYKEDKEIKKEKKEMKNGNIAILQKADEEAFWSLRPPTYEEISSFARSQAFPITQECADAFYDEMESLSWTYKGQTCLEKRAWQARFRKWATNWHNNLNGRKAVAK